MAPRLPSFPRPPFVPLFFSSETCYMLTLTGGTPMQKMAVMILAAGKSTRMKSHRSKLLHPLAGLPVVQWCARTVAIL